jgi:hypothetical protein
MRARYGWTGARCGVSKTALTLREGTRAGFKAERSLESLVSFPRPSHFAHSHSHVPSHMYALTEIQVPGGIALFNGMFAVSRGNLFIA